MHSAGNLVMCLFDFDGHIGRHIDGVHGRYVVGKRIFGRRNAIKVLSKEGIMCVKYMV